jgi:hypothetical protein
VNALKEGNRDGGTAGRHRVRRALVTAEVALAVDPNVVLRAD